MSAAAYYELYCFGLFAVAFIVVPMVYWRGVVAGRRSGHAIAMRANSEKTARAVSAALRRQHDQIMRSADNGRWIEDAAHRQAVARAETEVICK